MSSAQDVAGTVSSNGQVALQLTWKEFRTACLALANKADAELLRWNPAVGVYGIPTGGCFVAREVTSAFDDCPLLEEPVNGCLVVDDLIDSGRTLERYIGEDGGEVYHRAALYRKPHSPQWLPSAVTLAEVTGWVVFPWEVDHPGKGSTGPEDAVVRLLEYVGEDPGRPGLLDTPGRVVRALREMTQGYSSSPEEVLGRVFEESCDEVVVLRGISFTSLCEHHLLPFSGTADVGYLPGDKVVGLSKLARLVDCFAQRLQMQERLTHQVAIALMDHLGARGAAVVVRGRHSCMACRGVRKATAEMITSCMLGVFRDRPEARVEFLALCSR